MISVYAQGRDYHDVVKKKLKALGGWIHRSFETELKVFVDTAPVMEKPLAMQAGIGWQGKHTNLVSRDWGSWLFLGEIYLAIDLPPDAPERDRCGSCRVLPRHLPDRGLPGALPARRPALHLLPDDRAQGPDPARAAAAARQPHLWLRRLPGGLPLEQVRRRRARGGAGAAAGAERPGAGVAAAASTMPASAPPSPARRSSASAATASCATC